MSRGKHGAAAARRRQTAESERTVQMAAEMVALKKRLAAATSEADRVPGLLAEVQLLKADLAATEGPKVAEIRRWHEDRVATAEAVTDEAIALSKAMLAALDDAGIVVPVIPESHMDFVKVHNLLPAPNRQTRRARSTSKTAADRKERVPQDNRRTAAENTDRAMGLSLPGDHRGSVRRRRKDTGAVAVGKGVSDLGATCRVWTLPENAGDQ